MPALGLHVLESFRRDVFLKERCGAGVEVGAEGAERVGVAIAGWCVFLNGGIDGGWNVSLCHFETGNEQGQSIKQARGSVDRKLTRNIPVRLGTERQVAPAFPRLEYS